MMAASSHKSFIKDLKQICTVEAAFFKCWLEFFSIDKAYETRVIRRYDLPFDIAHLCNN